MRPPIPTATERRARTRIHVELHRSGVRVRTAVEAIDPTASALRPVLVRRGADAAVVSLVPEGALLLAGDAIEVEVVVGAGASLELIEPGGTVAFDMRGARARWQVDIRLDDDARLTWAGEPFVVAGGADVARRTTIDLAPGAGLALREIVVLGRFGESPGRLDQHLSVHRDQRPLLIEDLPLDNVTAPLLLGGHRVLSSVLLAGGARDGLSINALAPFERIGPNGPDRFDLDRDGVLWRRLAAEAHLAELPAAWSAARRAISVPEAGPGNVGGPA